MGLWWGKKQERRWRGVGGGRYSSICAGRQSPMVEMVEFGADSGVGTMNPRVGGPSVVVLVYFEGVIAASRQTARVARWVERRQVELPKLLPFQCPSRRSSDATRASVVAS